MRDVDRGHAVHDERERHQRRQRHTSSCEPSKQALGDWEGGDVEDVYAIEQNTIHYIEIPDAETRLFFVISTMNASPAKPCSQPSPNAFKPPAAP